MSDTLTGKTALVTGATGFIGRHLVNALCSNDAKILALARNAARVACLSTNDQVVGVVRDLTQAGSLADVLRDVDVVFHLASEGEGRDATQELSSSTGRQTDEKANVKELQEGVTVRGTHKLLDAAVKVGVKRFVFFSSVKAFGETTDARLDENSETHPTSAYGRAKLAAENLVLETGRRHGLHVCILRLPLVYGLDNEGNIPRMIAAIDRGRFPPIPEVGNKRSMVHVSDVVQAALLVAENPAADGQLYIVTDGQVYSTRDLYVKICQGLDRRIPGWHLPLGLWRGLAKAGDLIGGIQGRPFAFDSEALQKLFGSAWYSSEKITSELGYRPTRALDDGEVLDLGSHRMRCCYTPHVPPGWESIVFFEEVTGTLLCGDLFTHCGDGPAVTTESLIDPAIEAESMFRFTSMTPSTGDVIRGLADLDPNLLAVMHGSSFQGDGAGELRALAEAYEGPLRSA